MDDASPRKGCGCLPPEARITDGWWVLPLNTRCPWLVCLLILYQWLCKRCTAIIHTDEQAVHSILELRAAWASNMGGSERAALWMQWRAYSVQKFPQCRVVKVQRSRKIFLEKFLCRSLYSVTHIVSHRCQTSSYFAKHKGVKIPDVTRVRFGALRGNMNTSFKCK